MRGQPSTWLVVITLAEDACCSSTEEPRCASSSLVNMRNTTENGPLVERTRTQPHNSTLPVGFQKGETSVGLAAKLEQARPAYKPKFEQYIDSLPAEDREALIAAANDPAWSSAALIRVLQDDGVAVGKDTFNTWRRRVTRG